MGLLDILIVSEEVLGSQSYSKSPSGFNGERGDNHGQRVLFNTSVFLLCWIPSPVQIQV